MSCMKNLVLSEPTVDIVDPNTILTSSFVIKVGIFIPCNSGGSRVSQNKL